MAELRQDIEHHATEEETELFPALRETELDLYAIGRFLAARRLERLFLSTGRDTNSDLKETPGMAIWKDEARDQLIVNLRNIHAAVTQGKTMVEAQLGRLENYPDLKHKLEAHREEKDAQLERVERLLDGLGQTRSVTKDATASMAGSMSSMMNAMLGDEVLKNGLAMYALANFEAASYETLLLMAEAAGEYEALQPLQESLSEERSMAAFMGEHLRPTGMRFLQLRSEGRQASH